MLLKKVGELKDLRIAPRLKRKWKIRAIGRRLNLKVIEPK